MPRPNSKPDTSTSTGTWEGPESTFHTNVDILFQRVELLERTVKSLQQQCTELSTLPSTKSSHSMCHQSTQTELSNFTTSMDFDALRHKVCEYQSKDKDINVLKYFIQHNITPEADEIPMFEPRTRRYFWQFSRFQIPDGAVYRKKMDSDRVTELHQLVVPTCLIPEVLQTLHPSCGHVSFDNTWNTASKLLFWPYMHRDITNFSKNCSLCQPTTTDSDFSTTHELPSLAIQKAVCAITDLTKDLISITKQKPSMKHRQTRKRTKRPCSTVRQTPTASDHHQQPQSSSPREQHHMPQFSQQQRQHFFPIYPAEDHRDFHSTTEDTYSASSSYRHSPQRCQPYDSPRTDSRLYSPPRVSRSDPSSGINRSYYRMPPREHYQPSPRGLGHDLYSPGRRDDYSSPPRHTYLPPDVGHHPPWTHSH